MSCDLGARHRPPTCERVWEASRAMDSCGVGRRGRIDTEGTPMAEDYQASIPLGHKIMYILGWLRRRRAGANLLLEAMPLIVRLVVY
jgi:hypothetical protein